MRQLPDALEASLPMAIDIMAEEAQAEVSAAMSSAEVPTIKEETLLEGLDFTLPPELMAMKRPFEDVADDTQQDSENPEAKRVKTENDTEAQEEQLEENLALLVQNALNNVGDLMEQFNTESDIALPSTDGAMDDAPHSSEPPATFISHPEKFICNATLHALGNIVSFAGRFCSDPVAGR
jgi:hypothetical protein